VRRGRDRGLAGASGPARLIAAHAAAADRGGGRLAPSGRRRLAGTAGRVSAVADRVRLVPALGLFDGLLRAVARLRRRAVGRKSGPSLCIIDTQAVKCIGVRGPRGYDAGKNVLGRKRVALVDAEGHMLAVAVLPASVQDRDTLEALDGGKACWTGLKEAVLDRAFAADRCRAWSNLHGMRHRVVTRAPGTKGFVVLARRWVVERSFGWLSHWGGLAKDRAGRLDVSAARIAVVGILAGVEALLNPMPVQDAAS
jgi:putative transposase